MRRLWAGLGALALFAAVLGCQRDKFIRPPKNPEEYHQPPAEPRYMNPPEVPKDQRDSDSAVPKSIRDRSDQADPTRSGPMNRFSTGAR